MSALVRAPIGISWRGALLFSFLAGTAVPRHHGLVCRRIRGGVCVADGVRLHRWRAVQGAGPNVPQSPEEGAPACSCWFEMAVQGNNRLGFHPITP